MDKSIGAYEQYVLMSFCGQQMRKQSVHPRSLVGSFIFSCLDRLIWGLSTLRVHKDIH